MAAVVRQAILFGIGHICLVHGSEQKQLVLLQQHANVNLQDDDADANGAGSKAPINEKGYRLVADLKDDKEMQNFIRRAVRKEARYVKDIADLTGVVPFYSGSKSVQSYGALKEEIRRAKWAGESDGRVAPLSEDGYQKVVNLRHTPDMMAFARRILDVNHKKCTDEGALTGLVAYYDGTNGQQSFAALQKELLAVPWIESRDAVHGGQEIPADKAPTAEKNYDTAHNAAHGQEIPADKAPTAKEDRDAAHGGQEILADKVLTVEKDGDAMHGEQEIPADKAPTAEEGRDAAHGGQEISADKVLTVEKDCDAVHGEQEILADKVLPVERDGDAMHGEQEILAEKVLTVEKDRDATLALQEILADKVLTVEEDRDAMRARQEILAEADIQDEP